MRKQPSLEQDLAKSDKLAFRRREKIAPVMKEIHALLRVPQYERDYEWINLLREWLLVAYTLWPSDFLGISEYVCKRLKMGKKIAPQVLAALANYIELPSFGIQEVIGETEMNVQKGNYDCYITEYAETKYNTAQDASLQNAELQQEVTAFRLRNPEFCAYKKVVRRLMTMERNFRQLGWFFKGTKEEMAQLELDSLCYRFNLFGLDDYGHTPLLQKLSVNATPFGITIFIPRYWSLDYKRDLNWKEINRLHKAWGMKRQGAAFSVARIHADALALRVLEFDNEAIRLKYVGEKRWMHVIEKAGLPVDTDERMIRKHTAKARALQRRAKKLGINLTEETDTNLTAETAIINPLAGSQVATLSPQLEQAKALAASLSPAEKCELIKWLSA